MVLWAVLVKSGSTICRLFYKMLGKKHVKFNFDIAYVSEIWGVISVGYIENCRTFMKIPDLRF